MKTTYTTIGCITMLLAGWMASASAAGERVLTLPEAVGIALKNNPTARKSLEDITGAQFAEKSAKSGYFPNVAANYAITSMADTVYQVQNGRDVQVAHDTHYGWGVSLVQPLFTGFAVSAQHEIAKIGVEVSKKEKQQSFLDVTKGVKSAYYRVLLNDKSRLVADESVTTLTSHKEDAQRFYDHGIIRLNDLLRAKVALSDALQQQERAGADVHIALSDLNRWLSRDINAETHIAPIETIPQVRVKLSELIDSGLQERPQLQAMALVRKTMEEAITMEKSSYYPKVSLVGSYWHNGDSPAADNNDFENDHNASITLQASWTLFDGFKTESNVNKAASTKRAYDESIRQARDQVRVEIKSAYLNLGVAEHNVQTSKLTLTQAAENMRITQLAYRQEAVTSTEVLDAQTDLTGARTNYYQSLYGYLDALATLEHTVGHEIAGQQSPENTSKTGKRRGTP